MLASTLPRLRCLCGEPLQPNHKTAGEIRTGHLICQDCKSKYYILAGVALLVQNTHDYLLEHVKGISKLVPDSEIPSEFRKDFLAAKKELEEAEIEHYEEDLEAERVNSLYFMNHYLEAGDWWKAGGSPVLDSLIQKHWNDHGPFTQIGKWVAKLSPANNVIELGCGVGGLAQVLAPHCDSYLGIDSSFASVALARHLNLGAPYSDTIRIPDDLLAGPVSKVANIQPEKIQTKLKGKEVDFVVADLTHPPVADGKWDLTIVLNALDMLDDPSELPAIQHRLLKEDGIALQSCPYIWHERVAQPLRELLPRDIQDSARAAEWLYSQAGFKIGDVVEHIPWLFFKHARQLEIYSVHLFQAKK